MEEAPSLSALAQMGSDKVNLGRQLMGNLKELLHVEGVRRIEQHIRRETENLEVAITNRSISSKVLNACKLLHLECLVKILLKCRALTSVDYVLPAEESDTDPMRVDIVCENGACSVNVEAKNLQMLANSLNDAGHRILSQAQEFVEAATSNPEVPKPPQMCLIFDNELDHHGQQRQGMDDSLLEFVNSIVDQSSDRQFELHLNNAASQQEQPVQMPGEGKLTRRIVYIRSADKYALDDSRNGGEESTMNFPFCSDDKGGGGAKINARQSGSYEPPRKHAKRDQGSGEMLRIDGAMVGGEVQEFKTEEEGVYDLVHSEGEEPHTVVVMEQVQGQNSTYSE